jgi:translation initiation factor IF-1
MSLDDRTRSLTHAVGRGTADIYRIPEPGDKVRVTPLGYAGWVSGTVYRVLPGGVVEVDCDWHGVYRFDSSDVVVYRRAGE